MTGERWRSGLPKRIGVGQGATGAGAKAGAELLPSPIGVVAWLEGRSRQAIAMMAGPGIHPGRQRRCSHSTRGAVAIQAIRARRRPNAVVGGTRPTRAGSSAPLKTVRLACARC